MGQNLNGKKIYVSSSMVVMLKFHSGISNYEFADKETENLFERNVINDRNLKIASTVENFKTTNLIINEGQNTHLFILEYKEELSKNEFVYDFSDLNKLAQVAQSLNENPVKPQATDSSKSHVAPSGSNGGDTKKEPVKDSIKAPDLSNNEAKFLEIRTQANLAFLKENYDEAEKLYKEALALKPGDIFCQNKVEEIKNKKSNAAAQNLTNTEYNRHKLLGDNAMVSKAYDIAITEYNEALKYKQNDPYILSQLTRIDIIKRDAVLAKYRAFMEAGKQNLADHLFDEAELNFRKALNEKPDDPEAIRLIASIPKEKQTYEAMAKKEAAEKAFQKRYRDTLQYADDAFSAGLFPTAKNIYVWAVSVNKNDSYPKNQITKIDSILLLRKNESDQHRKDSLNKIKYDAIVAKAEQEINSKNYKKAIETLKLAQELMPDSKYPASRISEVEIIIKQEEDARRAAIKEDEDARKAAAESQRLQDSLNKEFITAMRRGNEAIKNKQYTTARTYVLKALDLRSNDVEATKMLTNIDSVLLEMEQERMYSRYVEIGDSVAYTLNDLDGSLRWYDSARALKPMAPLAKNQYEIAGSKIFTRDSLLFEQEEEEKRTSAYNESISLYKNADLARKEKRYGDAYSGYAEFFSKMDTLHVDKYSQRQQYYINHAMEYRKSLEGYRPRAALVVDVKEKYPAINFSQPPPAQIFSNPALANSSKNNDFIKTILSKSPRNILVVTEGKIKLICQGIHFTDENVCFRFNVQNNDTAEFLVGAMMLELRKSNGNITKLAPVFISDFPVVFPTEGKSWVYEIKNLIMGNDEILSFEIIDRLNRAKLKLSIPAAIYHNERIK